MQWAGQVLPGMSGSLERLPKGWLSYMLGTIAILFAASAWSAELQFKRTAWTASAGRRVHLKCLCQWKLTSVADITIWLPRRCLLISR